MDMRLAWTLCRVVLGMVIGAVFVSVLNDFTDLEDDRMAGKANRLEPFSPTVRWIFLNISIAGITAYIVYGIGRLIPAIFYIAACLSFILYSVPPFRFKKKGAWGVLGDALGASIFPMIFVSTDLAMEIGFEFPSFQTAGMVVWSLAHGIRGILWHQHRDRVFDASIGSLTFATEHRVRTLKRIELLIVSTEFLAFLVFVGFDLMELVMVAMGIHLAIVILVYFFLEVRHVIVVSEPGMENYMLFGTFYQIFCPVLLLFSQSGWSPIFFILVSLLILISLPDLRINYYLLKRLLYENPMVRNLIRKRDAYNKNRWS